MSKTDIPEARRIIAGVIKTFPEAATALQTALDLMTRKPTKKRVGRRNVVNAQTRAACEAILASPEADKMTDTEIAEKAFGHASAAGRVSEIRRGIAYEPWGA